MAKTIVYVFFSQRNKPFLGQKIDAQLESKTTDLWELISSKVPENYLPKDNYFTLLNDDILSGKHSFGSKKVLSYLDFHTILVNNALQLKEKSFINIHSQFWTDYLNCIDGPDAPWLPSDYFYLVIQKVIT